MKPVKLPERYLETNDIAHMDVGEVRYTLPWAIMVDEDMHCWINGTYPAYHHSGGNATMRVRRTEDGGVAILHGADRYRPTQGIPWVGATNDDLLPVTTFHEEVP